MPSAVGERQIFPKHTKQIRIGTFLQTLLQLPKSMEAFCRFILVCVKPGRISQYVVADYGVP